MSKTIKSIWNWVSWILVGVVVLLAIALVGVRLIGLRPYVVLSGSMEPIYHVGSLIYVKEVDPFELESGDVITFMMDEDTVVTHRIVEVIPDEDDATVVRFGTKGDSNESADGSLVHYKNVLGTPVLTVPGLGYVSNFIQKPPGLYIAFAVVALVFFGAYLPDVLTSTPSGKHAAGRKK